ncbi:TolC family protein [Ancylomarina longa]|uniref:TolC family protein n=1 Tax=Ancylomarina longa TaxID=2487017 RepID=A0A434AU41_9BACT|nr:TolC family protein [Ancylomarina longa]RUT77961.1 TolC family protein [Ancylomarina longa]
MTRRLYILGIFCLFVLPGKAQEILSLKESRKLALEYNQKIKIAEEMIIESKSNVSFAFTQFLPNLKAEGTYNYFHNISDINIPGFFLGTANSVEEARKGIYTGVSDVYFPGFNIALGNVDYYSANLNLSQPIYMGGKIHSIYNITKLGREISIFNRSLQKSDVLLETDQAYWNLVSVKEKVYLAAKYVEMLSALVQDLQNAFDLELTTKNELLKVQVQLNQAKLNLFRSRNAQKLSKMALCQVIGTNLNNNVTASDTIVTIQKSEIKQDYLGKALAQRPELKMLEKQMEINKQKEIESRSDYLPHLGVGASYSYTSDIANLTGNMNLFAVQANLSMPVFHWKERKHSVAAAKSRTRQKALELDRTKDLISLEVQQSYFNLQEAFEQIELARVSLKQASENVKLTKNSFYEGLANTTELLDAQAFWQRAYSELIDSKINYKLKEVGFLKSIGELGNI